MRADEFARNLLLRRVPAAISENNLPTGRQLAYRHGLGPAYDLAQSIARTERPPARIVDRATQAYRLGKLGLLPLARLLGQSLAEAKASLAEAGIVPTQRTSDQAVAAALSGHRMAGLEPDAQAEAMVRKIVDGDLTRTRLWNSSGRTCPQVADPYLLPGVDVLRNQAGITDAAVLADFGSRRATALRRACGGSA